ASLNKYLRRNSQGFNRSGIRSAFDSNSLKLQLPNSMIYFSQENCMYTTNVPRRLHHVLLVVLTCAMVFLIGLPAYAQQDQGRIGGVVKDANGAVVPGASVLVKNERTGEERTATSTESGSYIVSGLRPSTYTVTASGQNLSVRASSVQLLAGQE